MSTRRSSKRFRNEEKKAIKGLLPGDFVDLRDTLLGPLEIPLNFFGGSHSVGKIGAGAFKTTLGKGLQFEEFAVLGVEFAGTEN